MSTFLNDIKYGIRQLIKTPGFTTVVVLTLALGVGANATIFSFLDRILLRSVAVENPHELVKIEYYKESGRDIEDSFTFPVYQQLRDQSQLLMDLVAYVDTGLHIEESRQASKQLAVSNNYFSVLKTRPVIGRSFLQTDSRSENDFLEVLISHRLWSRRFGADPNVLGQTLRLNDVPFTIVGVTPSEFTGTIAGMNPTVYVTLSAWAQLRNFPLETPGNHSFHLLGRLKPGVDALQAQAYLRVLAGQIHQGDPQAIQPDILVTAGRQGTHPFAGETYWWLFVALFQVPTVLVLLVACANVANMLLARGSMRQREIAIRRAVGANRGRIIRQLLVESSLLALMSGVCGTVLAYWISVGIPKCLPMFQAANIAMGVDGRILLWTLLGSLGSVVLFGLAPALQVSRPDVMGVLKDGSGAISRWTGRWSMRNLLLVTQVAFSVIVLALGVLCFHSLGKLRVADPGFNTNQVLAVSTHLRHTAAEEMGFGRYITALKERITSLPGVQAVGLTSCTPLTGGGNSRTSATHIDHYAFPADREYVSWSFTTVGPGCFETLGIPLVRGRSFSAQDMLPASKVMIVNELMAKTYWPQRDPIGQTVTLGHGETREVIGVAKTVKYHSIRVKPIPRAFWPMPQATPAQGKGVQSYVKPVLLIRTSGDTNSLATFVKDELVANGLQAGCFQVSTLAEHSRTSLQPQRVITVILGTIGAVGLLFVATGLAGVMAYEVCRRTREIGVRMTLGARYQEILTLILQRGAMLTGIGLVLGMGLSFIPIWLVSRLVPEVRMVINEYLGGVRLWDPWTFAGVALLVLGITLLASWIPAQRAARIDPMEALRYE